MTIPADLAYDARYVERVRSVPMVLYEPREASQRCGIGVVVMHPDSNFLAHRSTTELVKRGFTVLAANPHSVGRTDYLWEALPLDIDLAIRTLRELSSVRTVVLLGHSAGGPMMSYYQNLAENGPRFCRGPEKLTQCPEDLPSLEAGDGVILLDSHASPGFMNLTYIDPSLQIGGRVSDRDAGLDMFDATNGFDPPSTRYSAAFRSRFLEAQRARNNELIKLAQARVHALDSGGGTHPDDDELAFHRGVARIWLPDVSLLAHTRGAYPLLRGDGSRIVDMVPSVRPATGNAIENRSYESALVGVSARQFLSAHSVSANDDYAIGEDYITGVSWASSNSSAPENVKHVSAPLLIMPMTAHYFLVVDELIYDHAASSDKSLVFVEGATHGFTPCHAVEQTPNQFGDTVATLFNYVGEWLTERF